MTSLNRCYKYFFRYFLEYHAIVCNNPQCVCRASTFQDLICEPKIRNNKRYKSYVEEILAKYKPKKKTTSRLKSEDEN